MVDFEMWWIKNEARCDGQPMDGLDSAVDSLRWIGWDRLDRLGNGQLAGSAMDSLQGWQWTACDGTPGRLAMGNLDGSLWDDWTARRTGLAIDARDVWLGVARWIGRARQWIGRAQQCMARRRTMDWTGSTMDGSAMYGSAVARCMALRRTMDGTARRWDRSALHDGLDGLDNGLCVARCMAWHCTMENFMNRYVNGDGRKRICQKPKSLGKYGMVLVVTRLIEPLGLKLRK